MARFIILLLSSFIIVGCSSNQPKEQLLYDAAQACAEVCTRHPNIERVDSAAGAGITLLFAGGMGTSCQCVR